MEDDRRSHRRTPTRLRPGKLISQEGRFLADCAILDRSPAGARIRLFEDVSLPGALSLYDESETVRWHATIVWSQAAAAGLSLVSAPRKLEPQEVERIAGRYYAVGG